MGVSTNYVYSRSHTYLGQRPRVFRCWPGTCCEADKRGRAYSYTLGV